MKSVPCEPASELGRTQLLLDALLSLAPDAIVTIDGAGIMASVGSSVVRLFGYTQAELVGQNVSVLMPSPDREGHDGYIRRFLETGEARVIGKGRAVNAQRKDGSIFPAFLRISEVWDGGNPRFVGIIHDLTEEYSARAREQELRFAMQHMSRVASMGELATGLAHEVNQPLTAITQYLNSLGQLAGGDRPDRQMMGEIIEKATLQAARAGEIITALRKFVGMERQQRRRCAIWPLIRETLTLSLLDSEREHISIKLEVPENLPEINVEPVQIQQVLHNLLRNAVEAVLEGEDPAIIVSVADMDGRIAIAVADNGPGIDPALKDRVFERFVTGRANGMGIGLAICRSIVIAHGGRVFAENRAEGGARIGFELPAEQP